jgi:hypothetical protein
MLVCKPLHHSIFVHVNTSKATEQKIATERRQALLQWEANYRRPLNFSVPRTSYQAILDDWLLAKKIHSEQSMSALIILA